MYRGAYIGALLESTFKEGQNVNTHVAEDLAMWLAAVKPYPPTASDVGEVGTRLSVRLVPWKRPVTESYSTIEGLFLDSRV